MDELTITKIKALRETGMSYKKIGLQLGVHKNTVMLYLCPAMRERQMKYVKKYYENNKDKINGYMRGDRSEYQSAYRGKNKERIKKYNREYNQNNIEKHREYNHKYVEDNKEKIKEYARSHYIKNRERLIENSKQYQKNNADKLRTEKRIRDHKRSAKEKLLDYNYSAVDWANCKNRFDNKCAYCGKESNLSQDHFIPLSKGGEYTINNIVPACGSCNSSKSNKDFFEWYPCQPFYSKRRERKILKFLNYNNERVQQLSLYI
jgi:5-methylcytosine-specific restriction endonuclease McrA